MYRFWCRPYNSAAFLVAMGRSPYLVVPCRCILVVLGLVISGDSGVILVGSATVHPAVAAALLCLGGVFQVHQLKLLLHGSEEGAHFA